MKKKRLVTFVAGLMAAMISLVSLAVAQNEQRVRVNTTTTEGDSALAISYPEGPGLGIKFKGTYRLPKATGEAKVERKRGRTEIEVAVNDMKPASLFGGDYSTYVLWVVSPEGQVDNVGEFVLHGDNRKISVTTPLQTFAMFVTAEPHYLVKSPSHFVVLETVRPSNNLTEQMQRVSTLKYRGFDGLYNHSQETLNGDSEVKGEVRSDVKQAMVSVRLAERAGAKQYASAELAKAREALDKTMEASEANIDSKQVMVMGHETVRLAVEAQTKAEERSYQAALDNERQTRARQITELKTSIEQAQSDADRARLQEQQKALALEMERNARQNAQAKADEEARARREAEMKADELAKAKFASDFKAGAATQDAEKARQERDAARARMQAALSAVVETRESVRGIIVNLPDILFDVDKATLKPQAREVLSKVCGIMQVVGDYDLSIEGHTDITGSDEHNQKLSEQRAQSVYDYLTNCGLKTSAIESKGFGKTQPIATNDTAEGRQKNRRVEIVIKNDPGMAKIQGRN